MVLTALLLIRFWREYEARLRRIDFLLGVQWLLAAKQQNRPLEAETTLNLLSDRSPF